MRDSIDEEHAMPSCNAIFKFMQEAEALKLLAELQKYLKEFNIIIGSDPQESIEMDDENLIMAKPIPMTPKKVGVPLP